MEIRVSVQNSANDDATVRIGIMPLYNHCAVEGGHHTTDRQDPYISREADRWMEDFSEPSTREMVCKHGPFHSMLIT